MDSPPIPESVTITLTYDEALRLSYMARFPQRVQLRDGIIADKVDFYVAKAEQDRHELVEATP